MAEPIQEKCDKNCEGSLTESVNNYREKMIEEDTAVELADIFKALGDPTRVKIIHALLQNELCVHDLTNILGMGQSAVSHQLRYLRNVRILKRRKEGKTVYYSVDDHHVEEIFVQTLKHIKHE